MGAVRMRVQTAEHIFSYSFNTLLTEWQLMFSMQFLDSPRLHVNSQNVTGSENGSVTISCYHRGRQYGVKWCKFGGQCITRASGRLDGASVEIRYGLRNTTVSMSRLKKEHTGWYWCSTEELQMPVHITVQQKKSRESPDTAESDQISASARRRTAVLFLLPVILEILLIIVIYLALKLARFCKKSKLFSCIYSSVNICEVTVLFSQYDDGFYAPALLGFFQSVQEAEEGQYVTMHRKQSSRSHGRSAADGVYESMAGRKTNSEVCISRISLYIFTFHTIVKQ
uniref:Polymeric immunoglobulin receptor-like n=1 Tax=Sinocyclocheilus grahami TaxID=75366 RepID=A0A672NB87_SINGR